jgi:hypothetical protein
MDGARGGGFALCGFLGSASRRSSKEGGSVVKSVILFFVFSAPAWGCADLIEALAEATHGAPFAIGTDWDGTSVDTDEWLVRHTLPRAVARVLDILPEHKHTSFRVFLDYLDQVGVEALPPFVEAAWRRAPWPFPIEELPQDLARRPKLLPGSSPLIGFWDLMAEQFESLPRHEIPFIPSFLDFFDKANQRFGERVHWVVVTARTIEVTDELSEKIRSLRGNVHPISVLTRDSSVRLESGEVSRNKQQQIDAFRTPDGGRVRAFLDNDERNLLPLAASTDVLLFHMRRKEGGAPELVHWP